MHPHGRRYHNKEDEATVIAVGCDRGLPDVDAEGQLLLILQCFSDAPKNRNNTLKKTLIMIAGHFRTFRPHVPLHPR